VAVLGAGPVLTAVLGAGPVWIGVLGEVLGPVG
jgi:hypothetical protein